MGAISFGWAAFFFVGGVCPVNRSPFSLGVFLIETMKLVEEILSDIHGEEAVHRNQIGFIILQRAIITDKTVFILIVRKKILIFTKLELKFKQIVRRNLKVAGKRGQSRVTRFGFTTFPITHISG